MTIPPCDDLPSAIGLQLSEIMPEFLGDLANQLRQMGEEQTADSLLELRLYGWCTCRADACDSVYTTFGRPKIEPSSRRGVVVAMPFGGMVVLDLHGEQIWFVEILNCPSTRAVLDSLRQRDLGPVSGDDDMVDWVTEIKRTLRNRRGRT